MKKHALVMDLDGVAYPFMAAWTSLAIHKGLIIPQHAVYEPSNWAFYRDYGMTGTEFHDTLVDWTPEGLYGMQGPTYEVARAWRNIDKRADVDIHVVTARPTAARKATVDWLVKYQLPFTTVSVIDGEGKVAYLPSSDHYATVSAVDDSPTVLRDYIKALRDGENLRVMQFVQRWNVGMSMFPDILPVHSGQDLEFYMSELWV